VKIGIFDPYLDTLSGGERYMLAAAACLVKEHDVDIFWDDTSVIKKAETKFNLILKNVCIVRNIFSKDFTFLKKMNLTSKYDVILFLSDGSIPFTAAHKTILHFQFPVEWVFNSIKTQFKLRKINNIICNSNYTKEFIDRKFSCNSKVIYPPVQLFQPIDYGRKEDIIITVGRFSKLSDGNDFKKLRFMINAYKKLCNKGLRNWKFIIATSYLDKDKKEIEILKEAAVKNNVKLVENISQENLKVLYASAKIYWHAAGYREDMLKRPDRMEHFGIATVEAMSAGCVPIVINAGGQKEIVVDGENGYLWDHEDELIEKTLKVASWKNRSLQLKINQTELKEKFGLERFCQDIYNITK
jgi:glycosyltransferase involved in cell wall biosynthesis